LAHGGTWMEGSAAVNGASVNAAAKADRIGTLVCFSHLRWNFVFQRPQHLMTRLARSFRVLFWEEPEFGAETDVPRLDLRPCARSGVLVAVPQLPPGLGAAEITTALRSLLDAQLAGAKGPLVRWYYTPM